MVASARLIADLSQGGTDQVWAWVGATAVGLLLVPVSGSVRDAAAAALQQALTVRQQQALAAASFAPYGIGHLDDPRVVGELESLREYISGWMGLTGLGSVWRVAGARLAGVAALVVVARWSVLVAVIVAAVQVLDSRVFTRYLDTVQRDLLDTGATDRRRAQYYGDLLLQPSPAKEVRLFGLVPWALENFTRRWLLAMEPVWRARAEAIRPVRWCTLLVALSYLAAMGWLGWSAYAGHVGIATFTAAVQGLAGLAAFGPCGDDSVQAQRARTSASQLRALQRTLEAPTTCTSRPHAMSEPPAARVDAAAVEFRSVTFTYPARCQPTLGRVTLTVPAGHSLAIVGVNGVGKSTLIKLLCGLYAPDHGQIRIDGADPATDDAARRRVAVIFQDYVRYPLSLVENVLLADSDRVDDATASTLHALHAAGGQSIWSRVGGDPSRPLSPRYRRGTDLSGGQWQRVALARALAAVEAGAGVLVLDEPTAALDVRAEAELFDRFLAATRSVTTILVSHRLSSVRNADRIAVLSADGIAEDGTHDELIAAGGQYAEMFALQAARFHRSVVDADLIAHPEAGRWVRPCAASGTSSRSPGGWGEASSSWPCSNRLGGSWSSCGRCGSAS